MACHRDEYATLTELDLDWPRFVKFIYNQPYSEPKSFMFQLAPDANLQGILENFIVSGAQLRYGKTLDELTEQEAITIGHYLRSIGYDADRETTVQTKDVVDYTPEGQPIIRRITYNTIRTTFRALP